MSAMRGRVWLCQVNASSFVVCGEPVGTASVSRVFSAGKKAPEYLGQEPSMLPGLLIADVLLK